MKYDRQISRLGRLIWRHGSAVMYYSERGPEAKVMIDDHNGYVLVGVYTKFEPKQVLSDILETKLHMRSPHYLR